MESIFTAMASSWKAQTNSLLISAIGSGMFVPTVTAHIQARRNLKNTRDKIIPIRQMEAAAGYPFNAHGRAKSEQNPSPLIT